MKNKLCLFSSILTKYQNETTTGGDLTAETNIENKSRLELSKRISNTEAAEQDLLSTSRELEVDKLNKRDSSPFDLVSMKVIFFTNYFTLMSANVS